MSFTIKTKEEILNSKAANKFGRAFVSAVIHSSGSLSLDNFGLGFELISENKSLVQKTVKIINNLYGISARIKTDNSISPNGHNVYIAKYRNEGASEILRDLKIISYANELEIVFGVEESLFDSEMAEREYIIGAFLGCGSIVVPETEGESGYHLEFAFSNGIIADDFVSLLLRKGFNPKFANRKDKRLVYFKDSGSITDMLAFMGAMRSVCVISEIVAERYTRNTANRQTNCQMANIDKAIKAAEKQITAINYIEKTIGLDVLDKKIREIAVLRKKHYDVGYDELGQLAKPPISKSGVSHRLRKLMKIAEELKNKEI